MNQNCRLCRIRMGAYVQCSSRYCGSTFHVSCGLLANVYNDRTKRKIYCPKHTPIHHIDHLQGIRVEKLGCSEREYIIRSHFVSRSGDQDTDQTEPKMSSICPVVPECIVEKIMHEVFLDADENDRKQMLYKIARYWTIKRSIRKSSLIRRLEMISGDDYSIWSQDQLKQLYQKTYMKKQRLEMIKNLMVTIKTMEIHRENQYFCICRHV